MPHFDADKDVRLHAKITFVYEGETYTVLPLTEEIMEQILALGDTVKAGEEEEAIVFEGEELSPFRAIIKQLTLFTGAEEAKFEKGDFRVLVAISTFIGDEIFSAKGERAARKKRRK